MQAVSQRLGYTASAPVYLTDVDANGLSIMLVDGAAVVYAGGVNEASHRLIAMLDAGQTYVVAGLAPGEVLSVQSTSTFTYHLWSPGGSGDEDEEGGPDESGPVTGVSASVNVTLNCTGSPCPWGSAPSGLAIVWDDSMEAGTQRLGYTASAPVFLSHRYANGLSITLVSGSASVYAGSPEMISHRLLGTLVAGQTHVVNGLIAGEVLSVQDSSPFMYSLSVADSSVPIDDDEPCTDPVNCQVVYAVPALWRCDTPNCADPDWGPGAVISWPEWSAYENNNRSGSQSRTVYSDSGEMLYPYMGDWAHGCEVTVVAGTVLVIEWERGTDSWRSTWLTTGHTYTINLTAPEDGALLESDRLFTITLSNCSPQNVAK
jgi:hypothetical protein